MSDTSPRQPALFVSHGSPMIAIEPSPAHDFLKDLNATLPTRPRAILSVTAHWMTDTPVFSADPRPETQYDFYGFPQPLYELTYPAPGAPALAETAAELLRNADIPAGTVPQRGFDHGTWTALMLSYPNADVPIVEMSIQPDRDAAWHHRLGQALKPLRDDNVLIVASGAVTHNLRAFFQNSYDRPPDWVEAFTHWLHDAIVENRTDDLLNFATAAPHAHENHPTTEHLLPLFVALGAGTPDIPGLRIHDSIEHNVLAMDAYRFD